MPAPLQNFAGMNFADTCTGGQCGAGWPPDTNGDVGPNHYIQAVNDAYAIYNKTGTLLASFTENALWSGVGTTRSTAMQAAIRSCSTTRSQPSILTHLAFAFSGGVRFPLLPVPRSVQAADPVAGGWWSTRSDDPGGAGLPRLTRSTTIPSSGCGPTASTIRPRVPLPGRPFNGTEFGSSAAVTCITAAAYRRAWFIATRPIPSP